MAEILSSPIPLVSGLKNSIDRAPFQNPNDIGRNWYDQGALTSANVTKIIGCGSGIAIWTAQTSTSIRRSTDYGNGFVTITGVLTESGLCGDYFGSGIVCIGTLGGNIFRSVNFGVTWSSIAGNPISVTSLRTLTYLGNNGVAIVCDNNGNVYRSTNFGVTWAGVAGNPIAPSAIRASAYGDNRVTLIGDNNGNVYRSTDFGITWAGIAGNPVDSTGIRSFSYLGNNTFILGSAGAVGSGGLIWKSVDNGLTWVQTNGVATINATIPSIIYLGNKIVLFGDNAGHIFRSTDNGQNWTDLGDVTSALSLGILTLEYLNNGVVLAGTVSGHIIRSDIAFKLDEAQSNYTRVPVDATASRALGGNYQNTDPTRTLLVIAGVRCQITMAGGSAYAQGKSATTSPPATLASPISGIQIGLVGEDNNIPIMFNVRPLYYYKIDSTVANGVVTLDKWFEMYL